MCFRLPGLDWVDQVSPGVLKIGEVKNRVYRVVKAVVSGRGVGGEVIEESEKGQVSCTTGCSGR